MREIRTYGSEGGAAGQPAVPTPIRSFNTFWTPAFAGVTTGIGWPFLKSPALPSKPPHT